MTHPRISSASKAKSPSLVGDESGQQRAVARPADVESVPHPVALPKRCAMCGGHYPADFRVCPRDAVPLEDAPESDDAMIGAVLADTYEIVRVIGEGGMGRVYEARHTRLHGKRYAIKLLHQELAREPEVMTRFQREAEAASALVHPNVVGVYDVNHTPDGRPYIVAELLEGEELGGLLDRVGKLSMAVAVHVVRQMCWALGAAHARGIIHRDMKPENVFLTGNADTPVVKVLDFGISRVAESSHNLTKTGVVMGTPAYMAPEQARGDKVDARADIYAVGAILYRALTGHKPFEGLDAMATLTAVLVDEPPRPCSLEPSLPAALELVVQKAMAKNPSERYATLAELDSDLAAFDSGPEALGSVLLGTADTNRPPPLTSGKTPGPAGGEATARTLLARSAGPNTTQALLATSRTVKLARPALIVGSIAGTLALGAGLVDTLASAIRLSGEAKASLTSAEVTLTIIGALAALATPIVLWARYLRRQVWSSSPRAVEVAHRLQRTLLLGAAAYGSAALIVHLIEGIVRRDMTGIAWPGWSIAMFLFATSVSAASWFGPGLTRRR